METKMDPPPQYGHQGMPQNTYDMNAYTNAGYAASPQQVNVVVQQPTAAQKIYVEPKNYPLPRSWKSGLCGCFDDIGNCLLTACFGPCMLCVAASKMNESVCVVCCTTQPLMVMRTKTRMMYGIQGSICDDCCVTTFCGPCAQCQMQHQLNHMIELP